MAEEILIAELRMGFEQFRRDMAEAAQRAESGRREIAGALGRIDDSIQGLPQQFNRLNKELKDVERNTRTAAAQTDQLSRAMNSARNAFAALGIGVGVREMVEFSGHLVTIGEQVLNLEARMAQMAGSAEAGAQSMAFLREETDRLGQRTLVAAESFTQIAAATKDTVLQGEATQQIFLGITEATTAMGKSGSDFQRVLNQVTQGINKQKVQLEDLQVIAENGIPAFKLLAEAMGLTGTELADAMQKGQVSGEAFLLLATRLREEYGDLAAEAAQRVPAQFRRLFNQVELELGDLSAAFLESKELVNALMPLFEAGDILPSRQAMAIQIDAWLGETIAAFSLFGALIEGIAKKVTDTFNAIAADMRAPFEGLGTWVSQQLERMGLREATEQAEETSAALEEIGSTVEDFGKDTGWQGLLPWLLGVNEGDMQSRLEATEREIRKLFGLEEKPLLDPKASGDAAEKSGREISDKLRQQIEDLRKKLRDQAKGIADDEAERAAKEALQLAEKRAQFTIDAMRKSIDERERMERELNEKVKEIADRGAQDWLDSYSDAYDQLLEHYKRRFDTLQDALNEPAERMKEIFANMRENIQDELADSLTDVFSGQLDGIEDIANTVRDISARTFAELTTAVVFQPMIDNFTQKLVGDLASGGELGGIFGRIGEVIGENVIKGIAGVGAGAGIGIAIAQSIGGQAGGFIGGGVGGATAGAALAPIFKISETLGGVVGGVVGALAGLVATFLDAEEKIRLAPLTSIAPPTSNVEGGVMRRGPFGFVSLVDQSSNLGLAEANTVNTIIAEADAAIARLMTQRQRDIVAQALQAQHFALDAREMDDAIAQALQTRLFIALRELAGESAAINIVGQPYTGTAENIELVQQRAAEALAILKMVEEFEMGPMSGVAEAIQEVNDQFTELIDRANMLELGDAAASLEAERQRQAAQVVTDFRADIRHQTLGFTDPVQQAREELERIQAEIWASAVDAGEEAMAEAQQLFALQWQDFNERVAAAGGTSGLDGITRSIEQFARAGFSGVTQQLMSLEDSFVALRDQAVAAGVAVDGLTAAYEQQRSAIIIAAQEMVSGAIYAIADPFAASMLAIEQQVRQFQQMVAEGLIDPGMVQLYQDLATEQARYQEALRIASGSSGAQASFDAAVQQFLNADLGLTQAQQRIAEIGAEFERLYAALMFLGAPPEQIAALEEARDRQIAAVEAQEAARRRAEAERRRAEREREEEQRRAEAQRRREERAQVRASIESFRDATRSGVGQQLAGLHRQFIELREEARRLGIGTRDLTRSFREQALEIARAGQSQVAQAIYGITNPFLASLVQIQEQFREFQQMAREGIILMSQAREFRRAALEQLRFEEASRVASGGDRSARDTYYETIDAFIAGARPMSDLGQQMHELNETAYNLGRSLLIAGDLGKHAELSVATTVQAMRIIEEAQGRAHAVINQFRGALFNATREAEQQIAELEQLVADGLIPDWLSNMAEELITANVMIQEGLRRISGGDQLPIEQLATAFDDFIRAGNPMSAAAQELYNLTETFAGLADAANLLGYSTEELEASYLSQANAIRDQLIEEIDAQMQAQLDALESIDDFISSLRLSEDRPFNLRFDEAQRQFQEALAGDDIGSMVEAARTLREVARGAFGSSARFFDVESQITQQLQTVQAREQAMIEAERQRQLEQVNRDLEAISIGRSSLDVLRRVAFHNSEMARGQDQMILLAREQARREERTQVLLERVLQQIEV